MSLRRVTLLLVAFAITLVFISCSSGPSTPQKGTPAFYWSAARETFGAADYVAALDNLTKLVKTDNEYVSRALPWTLILSGGMSRGYMDVADSFEHGARARKADPSAFRREMDQSRSLASQTALQFAETFRVFVKTNKDEKITFDFPFPTGSAAPVPEFFKIGAGIPVQPADIETAENHSLQRCVLLATCRAVGAPEDSAKAQEIFRGANVQASRHVFMLAMAQSLYGLGELYGPMKIDKPDKQKFFFTHALGAMEGVPETKETKALNTKIQAALKKKT